MNVCSNEIMVSYGFLLLFKVAYSYFLSEMCHSLNYYVFSKSMTFLPSHTIKYDCQTCALLRGK